MGIKEQCAALNKQIEKIKRQLMDGTVLQLQQRTTKENQIAALT